MKTKTNTIIETEHIGTFMIQELQRGYLVWWDYYDESDGGTLDQDEDYTKWILESGDTLLDGIDLSDAPEGGRFASFDTALAYLELKFGKLLEEDNK